VKVAIDSDDAGIDLKKVIFEHLQSLPVEVEDLNLVGSRPVDYPDVGYNLAKRVANKEFDRGILICGTGLGMAMIANKVEGVYAGVCHDVYSAERLSKSNDAQILTLGARVVGSELAKTVVSAWMSSRFQGGGSTLKVARMRDLEKIERKVPKTAE
jgi:ribose 5-phosphate isomerase B